MDNPPERRSRAWRRWQNKRSHRAATPYRKQNSELRCLEKDWSMMYFRQEKLRRAKQLRFAYPVRADAFYAEWFD